MWGVLAAIVLGIGAALVLQGFRAPAPFPSLGIMTEFALQDQNGQTIHLDDLRGKAWVADVIFTRCAGQCPVMTAHLKQVQDALPADLPVRFVSFTTDPGFDTPPILKKYAVKHGADESRWLFLTGEKPALKRAIVGGLKLTALGKAKADQNDPSDLFVHSAKFVLLDKEGRIRAYFDGETDAAVAQTADAARQLAGESPEAVPAPPPTTP